MKTIDELLKELGKLVNQGKSLKRALEILKERYKLSDDKIEELKKEYKKHQKLAESILDLSKPKKDRIIGK